MAGTTSTQRHASCSEDKITICTEDTLNEISFPANYLLCY